MTGVEWMRVCTVRGTTWGSHAAVALFLASCSFINETSQVQCSTNQECLVRLGADVSYSCIDSFCMQALCTTDEQCQARGDGYAGAFCGPQGMCTSEAEASCVTVADCNSASPTMTCSKGRCVDPWACIGELDDREPATQATATVEAKILNLMTRQPAPAPTAHACLLPTFDPGCAVPIAGTSSTYDSATGTFTMLGLQQDTPIRIKLDFPSEFGIASIDHYAVRTPHDQTKLALLPAMPPTLLSQLAAAMDPPRVIEPTKASISAVVFDCNNEPAKGVSIQMLETDKLPNTEIIYYGADGQIAPSATSTDIYGNAIIINAKPNRLLTLRASVSDVPIKDYRVMAQAGRTTVVHFQPRVYRDRSVTGL